MKLKSLVWTLGWKPRAKSYGFNRITFPLGKYGEVDYCKWEHPRDYFHPFPEKLVAELSNFVKPGDTVVDVGAHTGDYTLPLALAAGANGCVFAFEPNTYVYSVLEENSKLNRDKTHVVPVNAAIAEQEGSLDFFYSDPGFCNGGMFEGVSKWTHGHPFHLTVKSLRLENWLTQNHPERIERLSYVKVDTEGHELSVVRSMRRLLDTCKPTLHLEMFRKHPKQQRVALIDEILKNNYVAYRAVGDFDVLPGEVLSESNVMDWEGYDIVALPKERKA